MMLGSSPYPEQVHGRRGGIAVSHQFQPTVNAERTIWCLQMSPNFMIPPLAPFAQKIVNPIRVNLRQTLYGPPHQPREIVAVSRCAPSRLCMCFILICSLIVALSFAFVVSCFEIKLKRLTLFQVLNTRRARSFALPVAHKLLVALCYWRVW